MEKIKFVPAVLIGGLIWGLWHAPLIALGHNYGTEYAGAPWSGIAMMSLFCIVLGCIFTYLSNKTGSVWPAVIGHGAINGFAAAPLYFIADNTHTLLGPSSTGLIGMSAASNRETDAPFLGTTLYFKISKDLEHIDVAES